MISKWKHMRAAPNDGTLLLSDVGFVRYFTARDAGSAIIEGWYLCDRHGTPDLDIGPYEPDEWVGMDVLDKLEW